MGFSLRDLMRREKESRKRTNPESDDPNTSKVAKTDPGVEENESKNVENLLTEDKEVKLETLSSENLDKSDETKESSADFPTSDPKFGTDDGSVNNFPRTFSEDSANLQVLEETYVLLEDDETESPLNSSENLEKKANKFEKRDLRNETQSESADFFDENRLVYEQLNTAYCSNLEYEHQNILKEAGVEDDSGVYDEFDNEDEDKGAENKNVITSSNFGVSNLSVSANENLPVGFFDDQNIDAKARGKLTTKEAREKMKELSKKRSSYLKEAKYIQEKLVESHREKAKMENEILDHTEALKDLQEKVSKIKNDLKVDTNDLKVDPERDAKVEEILNQYSELDYDDLSWMSRSIV